VGVASADAQVAASKATLVRAQADARKAELDLARAKELRAANALPQQQLDNAQAQYDSAQASQSLAKAQVAAAEDGRRAAEARVIEMQGHVTEAAPANSRIAAARANAELAHASVKSATARLTLAKLALSYTKVTVPADGVASKLTVHEGQLVQIGQPVIQLVPDATYVIANFKETQVGRMKPGQEVKISVDAFPGKKLHGKVESLSGGTGASFSLLPADNASGNFVKVVQRVPVRISWTDVPAGLRLRAGMSADVTVNVKE
jgi:membrane fusion protein (multidrug efflux system)